MAPFATAADVSTRLGRSLTSEEVADVEAVVDAVTGLTCDVVGRPREWAEVLDPVPATLKVVCIEKAIQSGVNEAGLRSQTEVLGNYSYTENYAVGPALGVFLTDDEERRVRRAVGKADSRSVEVQSILSNELVGGWLDGAFVDVNEVAPFWPEL